MMHRMFYPVLILIVVLLAGVVYLISRPSAWWSQISASISSITVRSPQAQSPARPAGAEKPTPFNKKKTGYSTQSASRRDAAESSPEVSPSAPVSPVQTDYPFPFARDILSGTASSEILSKFGPPRATVTGADVRQLRERFIYIEKTTGKKTVIFLVNGAVISAETTEY